MCPYYSLTKISFSELPKLKMMKVAKFKLKGKILQETRNYKEVTLLNVYASRS